MPWGILTAASPFRLMPCWLLDQWTQEPPLPSLGPGLVGTPAMCVDWDKCAFRRWWVTKTTVQAMASFRAGLGRAVGKGFGTEVWETSLAERAGHFYASAPQPLLPYSSSLETPCPLSYGCLLSTSPWWVAASLSWPRCSPYYCTPTPGNPRPAQPTYFRCASSFAPQLLGGRRGYSEGRAAGHKPS